MKIWDLIFYIIIQQNYISSTYSINYNHRGIVIAISPEDIVNLPYISSNKKWASAWASRSWFFYVGLKYSLSETIPVTFCGLNETRLLKSLSRNHSHLVIMIPEEQLVTWWCRRHTKTGLMSYQHISYHTMQGSDIASSSVSESRQINLNRPYVCSQPTLSPDVRKYVYTKFDAILPGVFSHVDPIRTALNSTAVHVDVVSVPVWDLLWQPNLKGSKRLRVFVDWALGDPIDDNLNVVLNGLQLYRSSLTAPMPLEIITSQNDVVGSLNYNPIFKPDIVIGRQPPAHFLTLLSSCHVFVSGARGNSFENRIIEAAVGGAVLLQGPGLPDRSQYVVGSLTINAATAEDVRNQLETRFRNETGWKEAALLIHDEAWRLHDPLAVANKFLSATNVTLRALPSLRPPKSSRGKGSGSKKRHRRGKARLRAKGQST